MEGANFDAMGLNRLEAIRIATRTIISETVQAIERCRPSQTACTCHQLLSDAAKKLVTCKTLDEHILGKIDTEKVANEVYETMSYETKMNIKLKELKEKIQDHVEPENRSAQEIQVRRPYELIYIQNVFCKQLEMAYICIAHQANMTQEVRMTAHAVRSHHMATLDLMKKSKIASDHIADDLIPIMRKSLEFEESTVLKTAADSVIKGAKELQESAVKAKKNFEQFQTDFNNKYGAWRKREDDDRNRLQDIGNEMETASGRAALSAEQEGEIGECLNYVRDRYADLVEDYTEKRQIIGTSGSASELSSQLCLRPPTSFMMGVVTVVTSGIVMYKEHKTREQAHEQYLLSIRESRETLSQKLELLSKLTEQRTETINQKHDLRKLQLEKDRLDPESILQAIANISKVDDLVTSMITLWQNIENDVLAMKTKCDTLRVHASNTDNKREMREYLDTVQVSWQSFSATCKEYTNVFDGKINTLYGFLSGNIEAMTPAQRTARLGVLRASIERDEQDLEYERQGGML